MNNPRPILFPILAALILFFTTVFLFWPSVSFSLVNFDDPVFITHNPIVADGFSWHSIPRAFTALHGDKLMYTPLVWLSYLADCGLFGASPAHPWGFHLTNVLLHAANAVFLYLILLAAVRRPLLAFFAAAVWALHPLRVESVAWVTERKDTLSTLFAFASLLFYIKAFSPRERGRPARDSGSEAPPSPAHHSSLVTRHCNKGYQLLALVAFVAGLLSKPMLVTLPFLFLLLDYWPLNRFTLRDAPRTLPRLVLEKWPFFLLSLLYALLTRSLQTAAVAPVSLLQRLYWLPSNYFFYLAKSVWPVALFPMHPGLSVSPSFVAGATALFFGLAVLALSLLRRCPGFAVGLAAFAGLLFPVSGIVFIGQYPVADRYSYLSALGLSLALLALLDRLFSLGASEATPPSLPLSPHPRPSRGIRLCVGIAASSILLALAATTHRLLPTWKDNNALYARIGAFVPNHFGVLDRHFRTAFFSEGDIGRASSLADKLFEQRPDNAHAVLAKILTLSQTASSRAALDFAADHPPSSALADVADSLEPLLAVLASDAGDLAAAREHFLRARNASTGDALSAAPLDALALWLDAQDQGTIPSPESLLQPATAVWDLGARQQALPALLAIARDSPSNPALLNNVAWLLATTPGSPANPDDVLAIARQSLSTSPDHPIIQDTYAVALAFAGRFDDAIAVDSAVAAFLRSSTASDAPAVLANVEKRLDLFRRHRPYFEPSAAAVLLLAL